MEDDLLDSEGNLEKPSLMDGMRGTNIIAGLRWIRERELEKPYLDGLSASARAVIPAVDATAWLPMPLVLAHYVALDALSLSFDQRVEFGASVSRNINGVVLTTIARLAGKVGLSPLTPLARSAKLFARNFRGGAIAVYQTAQAEARFEVYGAPMAPSTCHRDTILGALLDGSRPFAADPRVTEIVARRTPTTYAFRIRW